MSTVLVALLHAGRVLVVDGRLPEVELDEEDDDRFPRALDLVGADVHLAPVLRLGDDRFLDVVGCRAVPVPDGTWVPPEALTDTEVAGLLVRARREHEVEPPPLRPAWFRPGWYDEVEAWVDARLAETGRRRTGGMRVRRVWSISAVLSIPTDAGVVWFKAPCDLFRSEPAIHAVLARHFPDDVPTLLASDEGRRWLLLEELAGAGESDRAPGAAAARWRHAGPRSSWPRSTCSTSSGPQEVRCVTPRRRSPASGGCWPRARTSPG